MRKIYLSICFTIGFVLCVQVSTSQTPPIWRYWSTVNGLSEPWAAFLSIAPNGNLWISLDNYTDFNCLNGFNIHSLHGGSGDFPVKEGDSGQLWTMYWDKKWFDLGGFHLYKDGDWLKFEIKEFKPQLYPIPFIPFGHDRVLFLMPDRLMVFDAATQKTDTIRNISDTDLERFNDMTPAKGGGLWITGKKGAIIIPSITDEIRSRSQIHEYVFNKNLGIHNLWYPFEGDNGELYGTANIVNGSGEVFVCTDRDEWKTLYSSDKDVMIGVPSLGDSYWIVKGQNDFNRYWRYNRSALRKYWFGLNFFSLTLVKGNQKQVVQNNRILSGYLEWIETEPSGVSWFSTSHGLARYAPSSWRECVETGGEKIICWRICKDKKGRIWFLCEKQLICYYDDQWKFYTLPSERARYNLCLLNDGRLVIPVWGRDFWIFNPETERFETVSHPDRRFIGLMSTSNDGRVLMETSIDGTARLEIYDGKEFQTLYQHKFDQADLIADQWGIGSWTWSLIMQENGEIWLGGNNIGGLARFKDNQLSIIKEAKSHVDSRIECIADVGEGKLWIGGRNKIYEYDSENFTCVRAGFDGIFSIRKTSDGSIWVASGAGLYRYFNDSWVSNSVDEGMPDAAIYDIYEDSLGRMWIGSEEGIFLYHSDADKDSPNVQMNESKNVEEIVPDGNTQFVYSGIDKWNYSKKDRLLYSHRIDDGNWSSYSEDTVSSNSGLSTGSHRFQVRAMDRNWNVSVPVSWDFTVIRPWYKQPGFLITTTISTILIILFIGVSINRHLRLQSSYTDLKTTHNHLKQAQSQLIQSEKMASLGQLVAGIAHEINNPIGFIKSNIAPLKEYLANAFHFISAIRQKTSEYDQLYQEADLDYVQKDSNKLIKAMEDGSNRITEIVSGLRHYTRIDKDYRSPYDLHEAIDSTLTLLHSRYKDRVSIYKDYSNIHNVTCSPGQINQVFLNLLSNAIDAIEGEGNIWIKTHQEANNVIVKIRDDGKGIPKENLIKIFDPFFTTKPVGQGTGLGLSISYGIIEQHGGEITVESDTGKGTTFRVTFPIKKQAE